MSSSDAGRLSRWAVAVVVAAMVGTVTAGCGGVEPIAEKAVTAKSPSPAAKWISVFLCAADDPSPECRGKRVTARQRRAAEKRLTRLPGVTSVEYESKRDAYENFRLQFKDDSVLADAVGVEDMPESFIVMAAPDADRGKLIEAMKDIPGVSDVVTPDCFLKRATCPEKRG